MVCTGVLGSEVGLWWLWLGTSSFLVICAWARPRVSWFVPFAAFGRGVLWGRRRFFHHIALVPSGDGASLSSGLLDVIVGVGSVVSRRVQGLSDEPTPHVTS
jgi:hypothetical protein